MDFLSVWLIRLLVFECLPGGLWREGYKSSLLEGEVSAPPAESGDDALDVVGFLDWPEGLVAEAQSGFEESDTLDCSPSLHFGTWSVARQETSFWLSGWRV